MNLYIYITLLDQNGRLDEKNGKLFGEFSGESVNVIAKMIFLGPVESGRSLRKQTILRDESRRSCEPKRTIFWWEADDLMKADDPILGVVLTKSRRSWSNDDLFPLTLRKYIVNKMVFNKKVD